MRVGGSLFGYEIASDFEHRRLCEAPAPRGSLEIRRTTRVRLAAAEIVHRDVAGGTSFEIALEAGDALLVRCSESGGFRIEAKAGRVFADGDAAARDVWEHRLVSVIVPLLLAERGDIAVHAAAVGRGGDVVLFTGASGRGKSTLALAASELGLGVLADDGAVVDLSAPEPMVWPGPRGVRVARGAMQRKRTHRSPTPSADPLPLRALAVLSAPVRNGPTLERLEPAEAVPALLPALMFAGSPRLPRALRDATRLAAAVPVFRCAMPIGVERIPNALEVVLDGVLSVSEARPRP